MSPNAKLLPVTFNGDNLFIVNHGGEPFVPMRPVVEGMGLDWKSQHVKLVADNDRFSVVEITTVAGDGKNREMVCIPLRRLFGWLMTVSPNKVKPTLREKIIHYQRECDDVLWQYWSKQMELGSRQALGSLFMMVKDELGQGLQSLYAAMVLQWLVSNETELRGTDISVRQLATETGVSKSSVARALEALEGLGLLHWHRDEVRTGRVKVLKGPLNKALVKPGRSGLN